MNTLNMHGLTTAGSDDASLRPQAPSPAPASAHGWKARGYHQITVPSGEQVRIRIPDLAAMLALGQIPDTLRLAALTQAFREEGDPPLTLQKKDDGTPLLDQELVKQFYDLRTHIVAASVVDPQVTPEDVAEIPVEDRDMIYAIAMRERYTDARGVTLGVEPLSRWETFRDRHSCPADCPHCAEALRELSTVDLDRV